MSECLLPGLSPCILLTLALVTIRPQVNWWGAWSDAEFTGPSPLISPLANPQVAGWCRTGHKVWSPSVHVLSHPDPLLSSASGNSDSCVLLEQKRWPNQHLPLARMCTGTEGGKNKSCEHNMQECIQICFMAELELFLIVNMSRPFVPPTQKCALLGVRVYS